jgi:hypothetical protein
MIPDCTISSRKAANGSSSPDVDVGDRGISSVAAGDGFSCATAVVEWSASIVGGIGLSSPPQATRDTATINRRRMKCLTAYIVNDFLYPIQGLKSERYRVWARSSP